MAIEFCLTHQVGIYNDHTADATCVVEAGPGNRFTSDGDGGWVRMNEVQMVAYELGRTMGKIENLDAMFWFVIRKLVDMQVLKVADMEEMVDMLRLNVTKGQMDLEQLAKGLEDG